MNQEHRLEQLVGALLRGGVIIAAAVASLGGIVYLARHGLEPAYYGVFQGEPQDLRSVHGILHDVLLLRGRAVIQLGILLLIATPIARVALTLVGFAVMRDRRYVAITAVVLGMLLYSLIGTGG